jgi:RNA polymerase sigma-70 factor (ECF subfamily)
LNESQEAALVLRCKAGDREAFRALVELHHNALFGTAYLIVGEREMARDVLQNALVKIWGHLPTLQKEASIKAWLVRIVANESKQQLRKKRIVATSVEDTNAMGVHDIGPEEALAIEYEQRSLRKAINELSKEQKEAVILRYFSGLTVP